MQGREYKKRIRSGEAGLIMNKFEIFELIESYLITLILKKSLLPPNFTDSFGRLNLFLCCSR